jgi:hypothetical protein
MLARELARPNTPSHGGKRPPRKIRRHEERFPVT